MNAAVPERLDIVRPDDWHLHLRDGARMAAVVADTAARFARAIVMPNLATPITTVALAYAYRERIIAALGSARVAFEPLMTLYLTDETPVAEIDAAAASRYVYACKLYPAGATTNSAAGVTSIDNLDSVLERMQARDLPLLVHGEVVDDDIDIFDREQLFIERVLEPLRARYPALRIVFEHVTTAAAVEFVLANDQATAATITPQHLLATRNDLLAGGLRPHYYCLPILKTQRDRDALIAAATSGDARFFLGTDSAPHGRSEKESACGCAGCYTAHAAIELYAMAFESVGALDKLEGFASYHGAAFYGLPVNDQRLTLVRESWEVPASLAFGDTELVPFGANTRLEWSLAT